MNEEKVITLKPDRKIFEDIYFSGNQGSLLFSPTTKSKTIITIAAAVIVFIVFLLKDLMIKENAGVLYFLSFIFLLCAVFLSVSVNKVSRWKKQVNHYLSVLERCKIYEIRLDKNFFTVNIDGEKETSEWKDFEYFDSTPEFISLEGKYSYMFPRKSMSEKEYSFLKNTLKEKVKTD
ncbi:YcxB family protein [Chryseobacterium sp. KLBC 52]|uniref:YcxB family protein n=1 Tax=Chryseobacterium sp. KLBC 52 TaxID=1862702 RepID=UPI000E0ADBFB|nr:YcxB family protein [Chryseobacterium sp. KLBC 52]